MKPEIHDFIKGVRILKKCITVVLLACMLIGTTACSNKPGPDSSQVSSAGAASSAASDAESTMSETSTDSSADPVSSAAGNNTSKTQSQPAASQSTSSKTQEVNYKLKISDYILDESVSKPRYVNGGFEAYTDFGRNGYNSYMASTLVQKSIEKLKLGVPYYSPFDGAKGVAGEWGYTFLNLNGYYAGDGMLAENCGWIVNKPKNKKDAVAIMKNWIFKQYATPPYSLSPGSSGMGSMNGHTLFEHYAGEWGFDHIGAEIGENIAAHQAHLAFTRGAARQYGKVGMMYFSNWSAGTIGTWEEYPSWPQGSKTGGHSMSLLKRSYIMSYMGGASSFTFEAGGRLAFLGPDDVTADGYYELSPYGKAMQELVAFSTKNSDIGINYTPIGVVLDYYHGIALYSTLESGSGTRRDRSFGYFQNTAGDNMNWELFRLLYPNAGFFNFKYINGVNVQPPEETHQVNTPYGDTHDVLLQNASQKVLNSYPCLLLSGDIKLSTAEAKRYVEYVKQGGTLILNKAYLPYFDSYRSSYKGGTRQDIKDGKGTVIVYGPDYSVDNLDSILREQLAKLVPFSFSKDVEYLVNVKNGSLIVTVINNTGVTKAPSQQEVIDKSKTINLKVKYTGNLKIQKVNELYYGKSEKVSGNAVDVTLGPGEYKVLEFVFG